MQKLEAVEYGNRKPEEVTYLPNHVDVASNIHQETRKDPMGNSETVWVADVIRYSVPEYSKLKDSETSEAKAVAQEAKSVATNAAEAVAELTNIVTSSTTTGTN